MSTNPNMKIILQVMELQQELDSYISELYYNSQPVITLTNTKGTIQFSLTDIVLIAAMTQANILLWGSSGTGKTYLAELIAGFLFGSEGYTRKNITPDMNEQDFMDIDFGAIKAGKKLKEAMLADDLFSRSCLIIDEANRAPPVIQNRLMQILENNIDLKSKTIKAGPILSSGLNYHLNFLTLNFGNEYTGTSAVDRALRDRITLDVPIDNFPPTLDDQILMIRKNLNSAKPSTSRIFDQVIYEIYENIESIQLSIEAEALILYLSFCSNCIKSPTGSKYGIIFSPQFCKEHDCPFARNPPLNAICPYTFAPSNRVLRRLVQVAKGFAILKHAKIANLLKTTKGEDEADLYLQSLYDFEVGLDDVNSIAPLILHSKTSMYGEWVENKFNGNSYFACQSFLKVVYERLDFFTKNVLKGVVLEKNGQEFSQKDKGIRNMAIKDDFHYEGLIKYVMKYLQ